MNSQKSEQKAAVNIVIITGIFAIITAIITGCFMIANTVIGIVTKDKTSTPAVVIAVTSTPDITLTTFRVAELNGLSVPQAKIVLVVGSVAFTEYTDSNGMATFSYKTNADEKRVFVETDQYEIYDQILFPGTNNPIEIRLKPKDVDNKRSVIIRVFDNEKNIPVDGAEVILIINGNIYSQTADSHGITKFTTAFPKDEIDGDISVSFDGYKIEHQRVTLQADRIQDVRLDKTAGTVTVKSDLQNNQIPPTQSGLPTEISTLTPFPFITTPTLPILLLSTVPVGCNEITGYRWLGASYPDRCFVANLNAACPNIEVIDTYCQCNDAYGLTATVPTKSKDLFDEACGKIGFPNPPAPLTLNTP